MKLYYDERADEQGDQAPVLYVERVAGDGALDEIGEHAHGWTYSLPSGAVELPTPEGMAQWCWAQIENVPMAKKTRAALLAALGLED